MEAMVVHHALGVLLVIAVFFVLSAVACGTIARN